MLNRIYIISSRELYQKEYPGNPVTWKIKTFNDLKNIFNFEKPFIINIFCIGDDNNEIIAAKTLAETTNKCIVKTIKFRERPKFNFSHLNSQEESTTSQIFHNSINQFSRINSISSINSSISNISNYEIQKVSTFKEKPKLGSLPLMSSNSIKTKSKNNPYGFFRSKTINLSKNNETKKNNKDEINKWLMRI